MRSRLRYLVAPIWILNIIYLFGSLFTLLSNDQNKLPPIQMGVVTLFFVFFIYLFYDVSKFNRPIFIKIIGVILVLSSIYYIFVQSYLMVLPTIITGIIILRKHF